MDCKFNEAMRLERLRDRLVSGIRDKRMMSELLKQNLEELTFDIAVAKCIAIEQSYKDVEAMQGGKEPNPVNKLYKARQSRQSYALVKPRREQREAKTLEFKCYRCHGNHDQKSCPFKKQVCHHCKKIGHIQRACKKRGKAAVDHLGSDDSESGDDCPNGDSDNFLACLEVNSVGNKADVIWVTPAVDGRPLKMELDTGSAVSVIPYKQFKKLFSLKKLQ